MKYQVMPQLSEEEFASLKEDIAERGVLVPVVLDGNGNIIDGHHRVRAWEELREEGNGVPDYPREVRSDLETDEEKTEEAWRLNMQRRHLNRAQKQDVVAAKLRRSPEWANNRIAKLLGVDSATVSLARIRLELASEIPKLEKLIGADGKEYPRHYARDLESQARYNEDRKREDIRRALRGPMGKYRSDEGIAEDLDASASEVAQQRESLRRDGPTLGEVVRNDPGAAKELNESLRELGHDLSIGKARHAISSLNHLLTGHLRDSAAALARHALAEDNATKAKARTKGKEPAYANRVDGELKTATELRGWLDRYIVALRETQRTGLKRVK